MLPRAGLSIWCARTLIAAALSVFACQVVAQDEEIAVLGPVQGADCNGKTASILGISFQARDKRGALAICSYAKAGDLSLAAAKGRVNGSGAVILTDFRILSAESYVAGASQIYIRGAVTSSDSGLGRMSIRGAIIALGTVPPAVGTVVEVLGSQPLPGGVVLPILVLHKGVDSSAGSGQLSSAGSGTMSSAGSGTLSSAGSATFSSAGSGKLSSAGSGKLSSAGSGKLSSAGSGKRSSAGSGKLSSAGSGTLSSAGFGKRSSAGSGKLSSAGSGKLSSAGSGKRSSAGSGKLSSAGSGKLSSAGSGVLSSAGSGKLSSAGSGLISRE
jgi:hypothetical protein